MIITDFSEPQKSLYIIGANIISILNDSNGRSIDPIKLFKLFHECSSKVSIEYFYFGLDWLYLIDAVDMDSFGNIKLCS